MSSGFVDIKYSIDSKNLRRKFERRVSDETRLTLNEWYVDLVEPWVPIRDEVRFGLLYPGEVPGTLNADVTITPQYITYNAPYARDVYNGSVHLVSTGEFDETAPHPLASAHWDQVAMQSGKQAEFNYYVKELITEEFNKR